MIDELNDNDFEGLKLKNQLCFPLYVCSKEIVRMYRPFLDTLDMTYTQYITMMVLWEEKKISAKELGHRLFLDSGTLTPVMKSLENKGYMRRYRSPEDERVLIAELTEEGALLRQKAADIPVQMASCVKLSPEEGRQLYDLLYKIISRMENE